MTVTVLVLLTAGEQCSDGQDEVGRLRAGDHVVEVVGEAKGKDEDEVTSEHRAWGWLGESR